MLEYELGSPKKLKSQTYMKAYHNTALQMYALAFLIHGLAHRSL